MSKSRSSPIRFRSSAVSFVLAAGLVACSGSGSSGSSAEVAVTIAPASATVPTLGQAAFAAAVINAANVSVTWQVPDANCGGVSTSGLYTAPAAAANCRVVVTSVADPTKSATAQVIVQAAGPLPDTVWEPLKVGAGGWVTGIDADPTGTTYVLRTDTYGGYVGDGVGPWQQIVRADTMPASFMALHDSSDYLGEGIYEIRVAPSNPNRLYMIYGSTNAAGKVYRSDNRGSTWYEATTGYVAGTIDPNDGSRYYGEKMAVDPANPDVVYAGSAGGVYATANGGASWSFVAAVGAPTNAADITGITFDPSGGTLNGRTRNVWLCSNGRGFYRSTDAGATWTLTTGGPSTSTHAAVATDGVFYAVNFGASLYRFSSGAWTTLNSPLDTNHTVACDPFNPARVIVGRDSGNLAISTDRGATWGVGTVWNMVRTAATDVPWLAFANESYMSSGKTLFDPVVPNKLWFTEGIGVWYSTDPGNQNQTTWVARSSGIEQLVANGIAVPPGSNYVFTAGMDRSVFRIDRANTSYPSRYVTMGSSDSLILAWDVDYSRSNSAHLVMLTNNGLVGENPHSGYSLDGGATWTEFPSQPGGQGGCIAAPSIDSILYGGGNGLGLRRSTNRGVSWTTPTGLPYLDFGRYGSLKKILAVDGANPNTVYVSTPSNSVYRSTDAGATWSLRGSVSGAGGPDQARLRAVPGQAGHLFYCVGSAGGITAPNPFWNAFLWRSTDGGATWTTVPGVGEPYDVVVGKAAPGATYPTVFFAGWYNGVYGIWRSIDDCATFTKIGDYPFGSVDLVQAMAASQDFFGDVYIAFLGSGWGYGHLR